MSIHEINSYLMENGIYADYITNFRNIESVILISIDGDWKHDHGYLDYLMAEKGYKKVGEEVTNEDGSDWYESVHTYVIY